MPTLHTPRLLLRDLLLIDLPAFYALASDPRVTRFQTFIRVESEAHARGWLRGAVEHNQRQPREAYNLAILHSADQQFIGWLGMGLPSDRTRSGMNFGYALLPAYWGQGYMTEALRGLLDYSFQQLQVDKITGECDQKNPASARVMEKAGLRLTLTYTEQDETTGQPTQTLRYAITRQEWENQRG